MRWLLDCDPFGGTADVVDFGMTNSGSTLVVEFLTSGPDHDYYCNLRATNFLAARSSNRHSRTGSFNLGNGGIFELDNGDFTGLGNATLSAQLVSTPEPSSLALLLAAMGTLGLLAYFRTSRA